MAWTGKPLMWGEAPAGVEIDGRSRFHLPAGTATFLLSDIEGSTRLWSEFGVAMGQAVADTYSILDRAIARHDGVRPMEQGEGDSVVGAFSRASEFLASVSRWMDAEGVGVEELTPMAVERFVADRRRVGYRSRLSSKSLRTLLGYLDRLGVLPVGDDGLLTPVELLLAEFREYLLVERGVTPGTHSWSSAARPARPLIAISVPVPAQRFPPVEEHVIWELLATRRRCRELLGDAGG